MHKFNQDPKPSYRNTRSKFFKKKQSNWEEKSEDSQGQNSVYWKEQGNKAFVKRDYQQAIQCYTKAIEQNPSQSIYFSNRARCYKILGDFGRALKDSEQACQLNDENIKAHYVCGCILSHLAKKDFGKIYKAENRYKKALRLCSNQKKTQFLDQISIKLYRLRKLKWYLQRQLELKLFKQETQNHYNIKPSDKVYNRHQHFQTLKQKYQKNLQIPDYLCCKITLELMEEPVTTQAGFSYQKSAIQDHFRTNGCIEPISRKPISGTLYPNLALKFAVQKFLEENPWAYEYSINQNYYEIEF